MRKSFSSISKLIVQLCLASMLVMPTAALAAKGAKIDAKPKFTDEIAHDVSPALRDISAAQQLKRGAASQDENAVVEVRPQRDGPLGATPGQGVDRALQNNSGRSLQKQAQPSTAAVISPPMASFEGLSNQDNFNVFGFRVNPPDPVGAVGPNHYVEMINLVFGVFDKSGNVLTPAMNIGDLWAGFAVDDCTDAAGDPIVVYDQIKDRWILSQFTTRSLSIPGGEFYNCVAISQTGDPTGAYYRYAFSTGVNFPDYPKYGTWKDSYVITTREFGPNLGYGVGVYALELNRMIHGQPARSVAFYLEAFQDDGNNGPVSLELIGDGLLPAYLDGQKKPNQNAAIPIVGTQDDGAGYGATFDALNIWDLQIRWNSKPDASLVLNTQLPVASFDSIFPCPGNSRDCLPQPGIVNVAQFLDVQSYRQRPIWRLAYRNFQHYEAMVTTQTVEASPGIAGMRWYEIRRNGDSYSLFQQGTYSPADGVHRWMGSVAMDVDGNIALGYSVVNGVDVFPGIRYTGRLAGDPLGQMTLGEATIINGTGVQTTTNSRWGDYSSLNLDPTDDCTFWYVNEYYTAAGQASSSAGWQTRIASFKLPGCSVKKK